MHGRLKKKIPLLDAKKERFGTKTESRIPLFIKKMETF